MSANNCTQFRPHHLLLDKCRNCFGDKTRHQQQAAEAQQQQATSEKKQSSSDESRTKKMTCGDLVGMSKEELMQNLKECHEARAKLKESNEQSCSVLKEKNQLVESYKSEIERLKTKLADCERKHLEGQVSNDQQRDIEQLNNELQLAKSRLGATEVERDQAREELRALEREMEEMHDNFKEEESEQFEQLKQELDLATKNCKILQIRLNKAERQYGQLEQVKSMLEHQLVEWGTKRGPATTTTAQLDLSLTTCGGGSSFAQLGEDFVKISSREYDQLLRDLSDTIEREKDLQEQIKYSQEEAQMKSDRLQAVEAENEVLLSKVNKLTLANSRLRSNPMRCASVEQSDPAVSGDSESQQSATMTNLVGLGTPGVCDLIQQNEQMKLALDLAQSEGERLRHKCQEAMGLAESREASLKEQNHRIGQLEEELASLSSGNAGGNSEPRTDKSSRGPGETLAKLELECRHLRTRLVHSERECKQLRAELSEPRAASHKQTSDHARHSTLVHSLSMEASTGAPPEQAKLREIVRQLREECRSLAAQNKELESRLEQLSTNQNVGGTKMESDLLEKLKCQLEASENELAKTKSRLVELDLDYGRLQKKHKRLAESVDDAEEESKPPTHAALGNRSIARKVKLPPEQQRDSMGRQELRQMLKDLEAEADELAAQLEARDGRLQQAHQQSLANAGSSSSSEEQVKSLRRLLDQERLLSNNLKLDIGQLEQTKLELQTNVQMLERERVAMEEELDKMRQLNIELDLNFEELKRNHRSVCSRLKDVQVSNEKLRDEITQLKSSAKASTTNKTSSANKEEKDKASSVKESESPGGGGEMLLMMRDLSELKVKNGFLMRQLEIAREDTGRQLEDLKQAHEIQQRRAMELAQIELKERHLMESQQLRDELNEVKQRLANSQRQATKNEEEASGERDRLRSMERDFRRDKSQWQQRLEQLEAQLSIERRSNEYKSKEWEALVRDKERELISVQDKYVQLERDMKRLQNKYSLLEESSESKQKNLIRDLEVKKRELSDLMAVNQKREDEYYENCKRFNNERTTLMEALESLKRSYDEKLADLKSSRELLALRQEQSYKERLSAQEQIEQLGEQIIKMSEHEGQVKLLRQQLQINERNLESMKRDYGQLKEERSRLKTKCEDLERRCHRYEKQELIAKTSHISSASTTFLRNPFHSSGGGGSTQQQQQQKRDSSNRKSLGSAGDESEEFSGGKHQGDQPNVDEQRSQCMMVEKLTSKINDQRHLINMLKQQNDELQLEVKQLRLMQSSDKVRWQGRVTQLQSRLNACEEKLLFETQLLNRDTFEGARRKLEVQWAEERQISLDTIQQQQAQNELLTRDLKKLGQAHELLRLQSKQLESHNNKLSRRLIEYQQQQQHLITPSNNKQELDACLSRQAQLIHLNSKLVTLMKEEAKPLIETVTKMVASLDVSSEQAKKLEPMVEPPSSSQSSAEVKQVDPMASLSGSDSSRPNSTHRPLMTTGALEKRFMGAAADSPDLISTATKQTTQKSQSPSRFARLLGKQPRASNDGKFAETTPELTGAKLAKTASASKNTKRVRVKSSSLGITVTEKKQLKLRLEQLNSAIDGLNAELKLINPQQQQQQPSARANLSHISPADRSQRASSSPVDRASQPVPTSAPPTSSRSERPHSYSQQRDSDSGSATPSRVHWQLQGDSSDLDSNKSWSASKSGQQVNSSNTTNLYRRFPQSTPSSYGASLTDYDSGSSLASYDDLSTIYRRFTSGAESDSQLQQQQHAGKLKTGTKKRTLRTRLTNTLRNISRSITGLASDSETESIDGTGRSSYRKAMASANRPIKNRQEQKLGGDDDENSNDADHEGTVREIRV